MSDQFKTRLSLILRLRHADDAAAWQEFVEIYQPLIFRIVRARGLQEADAFDTTQEVLARVATAINRWDPDPQRGSSSFRLRRFASACRIDRALGRAKTRSPSPTLGISRIPASWK